MKPETLGTISAVIFYLMLTMGFIGILFAISTASTP